MTYQLAHSITVKEYDAVPNTPIKRQWINDYNYDHDILSGVLWDGVKEASCGDKSKIFRIKITYNSLHLTYNHGVWLSWSSGCGVCSLWWYWNWISIFLICKTNHLSTIKDATSPTKMRFGNCPWWCIIWSTFWQWMTSYLLVSDKTSHPFLSCLLLFNSAIKFSK